MNIDNQKVISSFVKEKHKKPLTRTEYNFLTFLLKEESLEQILQIGGLNNLFCNFRNYLKENKDGIIK